MSKEPKQAIPAFIDLAAQRSHLGDGVERAISKILQHGQFILGPEVTELERQLGAFCGARHCVTCANGTDALLLALMAEDIGAGDAVFVPAFTFVATVEVAILSGATPVFVHHTVKGINKGAEAGAALGLDSLAFAGIGEYVRQWLLLNRRFPFEEGSGRHDLIMSVGGSAGHSHRWHVEVNEGTLDEQFKGRKWQVKVVAGNTPAVKAKDITLEVTDPYH